MQSVQWDPEIVGVVGEELRVSPDDVTLHPLEARRLQVTAKPNLPIEVASSNPEVVTVHEDGTIVAGAEGEAEIAFRQGDTLRTVHVAVAGEAIKAIRIEPGTVVGADAVHRLRRCRTMAIRPVVTRSARTVPSRAAAPASSSANGIGL